VDTQTLLAIIAVAGTLSGIALGWLGRNRATKQDVATNAAQDATLQTNLAYIMRGVDDMRVEIKLQGQRYDGLAERMARLEESSKSAHHRLNRLENGKE
jgi:hypothetical protein